MRILVRAFLALALVVVLGAVGYYFWSSAYGGAGGSSHSRARTFTPPPERTPTMAQVPGVDPGSGAAPALPPQGQVQGAASLGLLGTRRVGLPIANLRGPDLMDTFEQARGNGERRHEATDILAPRGTPVIAVDDGAVKKLFTSVPGGLTVYQYEPGEEYCYYYAHLDRYAEGLKEGQQLKRGDLIGYVGTTGNSDPNTPHLHFAILQLGPSKEWWQGTTPINAYPIFMSALTGSGTR